MLNQDDVTFVDHAAGTPVLPSVAGLHVRLCRQHYSNPHAGNVVSEQSRRAIANAEARLLSLLDIPREDADVFWTSGGTEADNLAILGFLRQAPVGSTCAVDSGAHPAVLESACQAEREGYPRIDLKLDRMGNVLLDSLGPAANSSQVKLVAVCHVNNETGAIQDLAQPRRTMRVCMPQATFMVDAIQAFGKQSIPWFEAEIDLVTVSGHKIGGPTDVGAVVKRRDVVLCPLLFGGGQQHAIRPGTLNTVGILEFVAAAEHCCGQCRIAWEHVSELNNMLRHELNTTFDGRFIIISPVNASPYILCFTVPGHEGAVLVRLLAEKKVIAGAGSACSAESRKPSHVLTALGFNPRDARGALRVSFSADSTRNDVIVFVNALREVLEQY